MEQREKGCPVRIKELRKERGYTQERLANELGVTRSAVAMWEAGKTFPGTEMLFKIADHFNVSADYIVGWTQTRELPMNIGKRITEVREARGLTPAQLAAESGIGVEIIEQYEKDECTPSMAHLRLIAGILGISWLYLYEGKAFETGQDAIADHTAFKVDTILREALIECIGVLHGKSELQTKEKKVGGRTLCSGIRVNRDHHKEMFAITAKDFQTILETVKTLFFSMTEQFGKNADEIEEYLNNDLLIQEFSMIATQSKEESHGDQTDQ